METTQKNFFSHEKQNFSPWKRGLPKHPGLIKFSHTSSFLHKKCVFSRFKTKAASEEKFLNSPFSAEAFWRSFFSSSFRFSFFSTKWKKIFRPTHSCENQNSKWNEESQQIADIHFNPFTAAKFFFRLLFSQKTSV
jgi:hypothetical protein